MQSCDLRLVPRVLDVAIMDTCCGTPCGGRCDIVLHRVFRARHVRQTGIGGDVRHGLTSGASCETSLNKHVSSTSPPQGVAVLLPWLPVAGSPARTLQVCMQGFMCSAYRDQRI